MYMMPPTFLLLLLGSRDIVPSLSHGAPRIKANVASAYLITVRFFNATVLRLRLLPEITSIRHILIFWASDTNFSQRSQIPWVTKLSPCISNEPLVKDWRNQWNSRFKLSILFLLPICWKFSSRAYKKNFVKFWGVDWWTLNLSCLNSSLDILGFSLMASGILTVSLGIYVSIYIYVEKNSKVSNCKCRLIYKEKSLFLEKIKLLRNQFFSLCIKVSKKGDRCH